MEELFSFNETNPCSCYSLLGHRTLMYQNNDSYESAPLLRGRTGANHVEALSPTSAKGTFEPDLLHKYSYSMQTIEYQYMSSSKQQESRRQDREMLHIIRPTSPPTII